MGMTNKVYRIETLNAFQNSLSPNISTKLATPLKSHLLSGKIKR